MDENTAYRLLIEHIVKPLGFDDCAVLEEDFCNTRFQTLTDNNYITVNDKNSCIAFLKYGKGCDYHIVCIEDNERHTPVIALNFKDAFAKVVKLLFDGKLSIGYMIYSFTIKGDYALEKQHQIKYDDVNLDMLKFDCSLLGIDAERLVMKNG